jgi:hypothetical protein
MGVTMRRTGMMLAVASLTALVFQLPGSAEPGTAAPTVAAPTLELGGVPCTLIPVADTATPVGVGTCKGVRPGGRLQTDIGLCTYNFLFATPDGQRYIGTAGHCILAAPSVGENDVGEKTWAPGAGPVAMDSAGTRIGEFVYAVLNAPKDFALIRIDPGVESSPEMCHFGGPTGIFDGSTPDPVVLQYFGNGIGIGNVLPARSALAVGIGDADHVRAAGIALPGDSGSGVISEDGRAVGVLVTVGIHGFAYSENGVDAGTIGITRLAPQVARAEEALGLDFSLVTAK